MVNFDTKFEYQDSESKESEQASDNAEAMDRFDAWQRQVDAVGGGGWQGGDGLIGAVTEMEHRWDEVEARVAVDADKAEKISATAVPTLPLLPTPSPPAHTNEPHQESACDAPRSPTA